MDIFEELFRAKYPLSDAMAAHPEAVAFHFYAGISISIALLALGVACFVFAAPKSDTTNGRRRHAALLFGLCFIMLGASWMHDTFFMWQYNLISPPWLKVLTALIVYITLLYLPLVIIALRKARMLEDVSKQMAELKHVADEIKKQQENKNP